MVDADRRGGGGGGGGGGGWVSGCITLSHEHTLKVKTGHHNTTWTHMPLLVG